MSDYSIRLRMTFNRGVKKQTYPSRCARIEKNKNECIVSLTTKSNHHTLSHSILSLSLFLISCNRSNARPSKDSLCFFSHRMLLSIDIKPHKATVILGTESANRYRIDRFASCRSDPVELFKPAGFHRGFCRFFYQFCDIKKGLFCPVLSIFMALTTNRYESKGEDG